MANSVPVGETKADYLPLGLARDLDLRFAADQIEAAESYLSREDLLLRTRRLEARIEFWRDPAKAYVLKAKSEIGRDEQGVFNELYGRQVEALAIRDFLNQIANQNAVQSEADPDRVYRLSGSPISAVTLRMVKTTGLMPDTLQKPGGKPVRLRRVVFEPQGLFKDFLDVVELDRIKKCLHEKCGKIFWASRIDRPCCSESCRAAYKQKRHREREKQNRPYKKRLLQKKGSARLSWSRHPV
jgi:hypothetical protein